MKPGKIFIVIILLCFSFRGSAQDIHFSQFMVSPLILNPAATGAFDGAYRFSGIYRKQWRSVTIPYQTVGLSADARSFGNRNLNAGINFYYDNAGDSRYTTLMVGLNGAWSIPFDRKRTRYLNIGVQVIGAQRTIDFSRLKFDSQYIPGDYGGYYDPDNPSYENLQKMTFAYPDVNAGIFYNYKPGKRTRISAGASVFNLTGPKQGTLSIDRNGLDRRIVVHSDASFMTSQKTDILPQILLMKQGRLIEATVGSMFKYTVSSGIYRYRAVYAGIYTRVRDAVYVTAGLDYNEFYFGASYDLNYSRLIPASHGRGGWELSAVYIIGKMPDKRKYRSCPDFM
jgi:type IX secretion system PorP/SprF family membrane protein